MIWVGRAELQTTFRNTLFLDERSESSVKAFVLSSPVSPPSVKMKLLASPSQEQWYDLLEEASPHICIFPGLQVHVQTARQNHRVFKRSDI